MLDESHNIIGEEEVGERRYEDSTDVGGKNAATTGVAGATSCVRNNWPYGRLDKDSPGEMAPAYPQAPPLSFERQRIGNVIAIGGVVSPVRVKELDCRFEEE